MSPKHVFHLVCVLGCILTGCGRESSGPPMFRLLPPDRTGVSFTNTITTNDSVNVQTDSFVYNGGGVAIGDIDNDGWQDLFLTGNMVSSRLYVNKGNMEFEDVTESAGVATERWASGVSMVDIDSDGYLDIYVSVSGPEWNPPDARANLLFLNNGDRTFREAAAQYGIDDTGFTTHAVFFDYDRDGHLDLFLLTNSPGEFSRGEAERHPAGVRSDSSLTYDRLYRNNGNGTFTDVSTDAGLSRDVGFGLGVVVTDINVDGWPDIYVSNDDTPDDVLYVNNRDGTFTNRAPTWLKHTSFAGMGIDIADFNNDGWPDILQTDMTSDDLSARKRMTGTTSYRDFVGLRRRGFHYAYNTNTLHLNNGVGPDGNVIFSEIAHLAGVAYTDWSWSALFGDYDNDGFKDILITNGYPKAVIDYDYQLQMFAVRRAGDDAGHRRAGDDRRALEILENLNSYEASNYIFRNNGDLTFGDKTSVWGMERPSFSYGAAHADLDNDGRLDLVVNNIDAPAYIYHNVRPPDDSSHYLQIILEGDAPNTRGLDTRLTLVAGGQKQYVYHTPYRGYLSSMDDRIHVGLGDAQRVDTLEVFWPDGRYQVLTGIAGDRMLTVRQEDATETRAPQPRQSPHEPIFERTDLARSLSYMHQEKAFIDYSVQAQLPYLISRHGPPLAVGDVTGDGLDDVFVGSAAEHASMLFVQREDGGFVSMATDVLTADKDYEDWGALFFDANGDGLLDLYVASGGYHLSPVSDLLQDRLYVNHGEGRFVRDTAALPEMHTSTSAIAAGDFNGDGSVDLFVGGRLVPGDYPLPTRSYLLRNDGGRFTDVTNDLLPDLVTPGGMITDAVWMDMTGDGHLDLVTAGEWMPVQFYANDGRRFRNVTGSTGLPENRGWWYSLARGDFDGDGHEDIVAGNLGLNHTYTTSPASLFGVYAADFTMNGTTDIVFTKEVDGAEYPFYGLAKLGEDIYPLGFKFSTYRSFASASIDQMFSASELQQALHYQVDTFASVMLKNHGDGTLTSMPLPNLAQIAPINSIVIHDVDDDGHLDVIIAGNQYHTEPNTARVDAGNGLWLRNDGQGWFTPTPPTVSGFSAPGQVTDMALIRTRMGSTILVANNSDSLQVFGIRIR